MNDLKMNMAAQHVAQLMIERLQSDDSDAREILNDSIRQLESIISFSTIESEQIPREPIMKIVRD